MKLLKLLLTTVVTTAFSLGISAFCQDDTTPVWKLREREEISDVWNGAPVGFTFLKRSDAMYIAFYSYDQVMTIGKRAYDAKQWEFKKLPTKVGWDSHNYVTMTFDTDDCLHVSGNMHACPLIYFRASKPNDIESLESVKSMVGQNEQRCTYPSFLNDKQGRLIFTYRDGASGNGNQIWNVYDEKTKTWTRLLDRPLFDGQTLMNAYFVGPTLGADGYFHVAWVWRDTPDAATNHDLSYARSPDLIHWEKSTGEAYALPITIDTGEIVDPVPAQGGILNSLVRMAFDQKNRVVLTYTKYDENGALQIWNARLEEDGWNKVPCTDWDYTWKFSGGGCLPGEFNMSEVRKVGDDKLSLSWTQVSTKKSGVAYMDLTTLKPCEAPKASDKPSRPEYSSEDAEQWRKRETDDARLLVQARTIDVNGERWIFRWEAPTANRDRPLPDGKPAATTLRVFKFERND